MSQPPFAPTLFAAPDILEEVRGDGTILLSTRTPLAAYERQIGDWLRRWAAEAPDRPLLAEEGRALTYGEARSLCDGISQALLDRGLGIDRPVMVLSEKSVGQALLSIAAMQVGIPFVPVSPAYSLRPEAQARLVSCLAQVTPGLVLVEERAPFERALALLDPGIEVVDARGLDALARTPVTGMVDRAFATLDPDAPVKILFTSGSTGQPKPAINTHRMMCSNAAAQRQLFPFLGARPPVVVDWQPWHHCGGANFNFHSAFANGGLYFFDLGKPLPDQFAPTVAALRRISPTIHFNVPLGYDLLCFHLERDAVLRETFFRDLECMVYSGALMPDHLWRKLDALAVQTRGIRIPMVSAYGMTETGPLHTLVHWPADRSGLIGCPIPGSVVKLVPQAGRLELRCKGPNVTPGYHRAPDLTEKAFDEEGFFRTGDAVSFVDPDDPDRGLAFDGRLVEEFKLVTGTWVPSGSIRAAIISACAPHVQDALVVGEGRSEVGLLVIPNLPACREAFGRPDLTLRELIALPALAVALKAGLDAYNRANGTSSRRIGRALPIDDVPSLAAGETTDKGYINQKLAIERRRHLVAELYEGARALRL